MMRFLSLILLGMCTCVVFVVLGLSVMHVLLFVLHGCMLRECEGGSNAGLGRCGCGECVYGWYTWFRCFV